MLYHAYIGNFLYVSYNIIICVYCMAACCFYMSGTATVLEDVWPLQRFQTLNLISIPLYKEAVTPVRL